MWDSRSIVKRGSSVLAAALAILFAAPSQAQADQTVVVRSGNGAINSQDTQVRYLSYGTTGDITPTPADFVSAQTGPFAYVVAPYANSYLAALPHDPTAQWVARAVGWPAGTTLYAIPFHLADATITSATLNFYFSVDNAVNGLFLNGQRISGNSYDGDYHAEYNFVRSDIAPLLMPNAINWLYVNASDYGLLAALMFSATITTTGGSNNVSPKIGGNAGYVTLDIIGQNFSTNSTTVTLHAIGQPDITGISPAVISSSEVTDTFNLQGAPPGVRDVVVSQTGMPSITYPDSFTVQAGGAAELGIDIIGPNRIRASREATFDIVVSNSGSIDAPFVSVQAEGDTATQLSSRLSAQVAPLAQLLPGCLVGLTNIYVPTGTHQQISVNCTPQGAACYDLTGTVNKNKPPKDCTVQKAALDAAATNVANLNNALSALILDLEFFVAQFNAFCSGATNTPRCFSLQQQIAQTRASIATVQAELDMATRQLARARAAYEICLAGGNISATNSTTVTKSAVSLPAIISSSATTPPTQVTASLQFCGVTSVDPNAKFGVSGSGLAQYVRTSIPLSYTILFENLPTAGAAASQVVVTDVLDSGLDLSTLSISSMRFGSTDIELPSGMASYTTTLDLTSTLNLFVSVSAQLAGNTLNVTFTSIDPATGNPPNDLRGFLPPDTNPPGGEGSISFTIMPKQSLATETQIKNGATVVFDTNAPINTPTWLNTVDNTSPISAVTPLGASQNSPNFTVQWQGSDVGSGIQDFTLYVSRDGGTFVPWLINTTLSQATYTGQAGHTYAFYSTARDAVGNVENGKNTADATTIVQVSVPGDVNGDGKVDCTDIAIVRAAFGASAGDPKYDVRADVNGDGVVDIRDLAFVAQRLSPMTPCQ